MKKQIKQQQKYEIDEFEEHAHLWNIVPGGNGTGIVLLRKIVDSIQNNFTEPLIRTPSFLIVGKQGTGKKLVARAVANSLAIEDIRICPARYFDNGIYSHQFFNDSIANTAHILTDIEDIKGLAEPTLWKYIKYRECNYFNPINRDYSNVLHCNGWLIMTTTDTGQINDAMLSAIDYIIHIDDLNRDQLEAIVHQKLVFCNVEYRDEVLGGIIDAGEEKIGLVMEFLKRCLIDQRQLLLPSATIKVSGY